MTASELASFLDGIYLKLKELGIDILYYKEYDFFYTNANGAFSHLRSFFIIINTNLVQEDAWRVCLNKEDGIYNFIIFNEDLNIVLWEYKSDLCDEILNLFNPDISVLKLT